MFCTSPRWGSGLAEVEATGLESRDKVLGQGDRAVGAVVFSVGVEEFLRCDLSVWREAGRGCVYGDVSVEDGQICFQYDDEDLPICWVPFSDGERFFFATGAPGPVEMQEVVAITDKTLDCPVKPGV